MFNHSLLLKMVPVWAPSGSCRTASVLAKVTTSVGASAVWIPYPKHLLNVVFFCLVCESLTGSCCFEGHVIKLQHPYNSCSLMFLTCVGCVFHFLILLKNSLQNQSGEFSMYY